MNTRVVSEEMTDEQRVGLDVARDIVAHGGAVFIAKPDQDSSGEWDPRGGTGGCGYWLPQGWQRTEPNTEALDEWQPGDALCWVQTTTNALDVDPYHGGDRSFDYLTGAGFWPTVIGVADTPSLGKHHIIAPLDVGSATGIQAGIDLRGSRVKSDHGRGFIFIAPTLKLAKDGSGEVRPYRWVTQPAFDELQAEDDSGLAIAALVTTPGPVSTPQSTGNEARAYDALDHEERIRVAAWTAQAVAGECAEIAAMKYWQVGRTDDRGRGWEKRQSDAAYRLGALARASWSPLTREAALTAFIAAAPTDGRWTTREVRAKFDAQYERAPVAGYPQLGNQPGSFKASNDGASGLLLAHEERVEARLERLRVDRDAKVKFEEETAGGPKPIDIATVQEVLARPTPPRERIEGLLPAGGRLNLSAQRKVGKTTFMLNMAHCLLTGEKFLGSFGVERLNGVLGYLNFEMDAATFARWASEAGIPPDQMLIANLRGAPNPFRTMRDRKRLAHELRAAGVEFLVVDTFSRAYPGDDHRDEGKVGQFLSMLDEFTVSEVGASELALTTHQGWNEGHTRGSSALEDWPDSIVYLNKKGDDRTVRAFGRDVDLDERILEWDAMGRTLTVGATGSVAELRNARRRAELLSPILGIVRDHPGLSATKIGVALRNGGKTFSNTELDSTLIRLVQSGELEKQLRQGRGGGFAYFPPSEAKPTSTKP